MGTIKEKRKNVRKIFQSAIVFELSSMEEGLLQSIRESGQGMDISSGGLSLRTTHTLKKGEVLKLFLPSLARSAALPVFSEVVWVRKTEGYVKAGLRFL